MIFNLEDIFFAVLQLEMFLFVYAIILNTFIS